MILPRILLVTCIAAGTAVAGQNAAPSSHIVFDDNFPGDIIINEVRVPKDGEALYTYYETLGWSGKGAGYAGIQAHPKAHNFIFSIWDHKEHTAPIRAVHHGPGTLTEKFGGEGTGLKSWNFELGWETDTWYTLISRCWLVEEHTFYGFWSRSGKTGEWTHLITMDVAAKEAWFQGHTDSFIEDWLETGVKARTTNLRGGWKRKLSGEWHPFGGARYSVNSWDLDPGKRSFNFKTNWNGGVAKDENGEEYYFMTAGGEKTSPTAENPSQHAIERKEKLPGHTPIKINSAKAHLAEDGSVVVTWENDSATLPQFSYRVEAHDNLDGKGDPISLVIAAQPHVRSAKLELPAAADPGDIVISLTHRDILDNESPVLRLRLDE
ncbi:MAG: hypothetical protein ACI8UO_002929 [Verrucomicrobiales bacterium]|jgi:hypothetical protein